MKDRSESEASRKDGYVAFISYSHADQAIARRLQTFIEHFRHADGEGGKPRRIGRCFRDDDELAGGALTNQIVEALARSEALIVVCTPRSAQSEWVALEIETFRDLHPQGRIIALWFDPATRGQAALPAGLETLDLFVPEEVNFGETGLFNRAVAALLNEPLDALVQRQEVLLRREQRRARLTLIAGVTLMVIAAGGLGASLFLGWRNASARSEILASSAQFQWDAHNPRLAGLLSIAASHGEAGWGPEAAGVHPLLVDILASPTLPLGVYAIDRGRGTRIHYASGGQLVAVSVGAERILATDILNAPSALQPAGTGSQQSCANPVSTISPISSAPMQWSLTPGCQFAYAGDGYGAHFYEVGRAFNRASAGGAFNGEVTDIEVSPRGSLAVTRGDGGISYVVSLNSSEIHVSGDNIGVSAVGFAGDDAIVALGREDGTVKLWTQDPDTFFPQESEIIYGAPISAGPVRHIAFAPGNDEFAVLYDEGVVARFRNAAATIARTRIARAGGFILDFPHMTTPVLLSADSRSAFVSNESTAILWNGRAEPTSSEDDDMVRSIDGGARGRLTRYEDAPAEVVFVGSRLAALDGDAIYFAGERSARPTLPSSLRGGRIVGSCSDSSILVATGDRIGEVGVTDGALRGSWNVLPGERFSAACAAGGRLLTRNPDGVRAIERGGASIVLRSISGDDAPWAYPVVPFDGGRQFITRGEPNVLLVGDVRSRRVSRVVVSSDADIVGYGILPGGQFAMVGAQYGLDRTPCVEWRLLHLATRRMLSSVQQGRPEDVYCVRLGVAGEDGRSVDWIDEAGAGYTTPLATRRDAWRNFCDRARTWAFTDAEQAIYASLIAPARMTPCERAPQLNVQTSSRDARPRARGPTLPNSLSTDAEQPQTQLELATAPSAPAGVPPESFALTWPVQSKVFETSGSDERFGLVHFASPAGEVVHAAAAGQVIYAGNDLPEQGYLVIVRHAMSYATVYGYLAEPRVVEGATVAVGDALGVTDSRGRLLFQLRHGSEVVESRPFFPIEDDVDE